MARHDREESLEEQLAWLDAIKETEEAPVPVSASAASTDEPIASPYPADPWLLVPQHDTPTPPLFRAAVDSVYGPEAAEEVPERESEAGEWLGRAALMEPAASEPSVEDPFHAPLKPLPRPDDTDTYAALPFTPPDASARSEQPEQVEETSWPPPAAEELTADWSREVERLAAEQARTEAEPAHPEAARDSAARDEAARDEAAQAESARSDTGHADADRPELDRPEAAHTEAEAARVEEEPARQERTAWADTQPRNESPAWAEEPAARTEDSGSAPKSGPTDEPAQQAESPETLPRADLPQWQESSQTMPRSDRPQWSDPEARAQEHRLTWSEQQQERPHRDEPQSERQLWSESPTDRPQWNEPQTDRPQWSEPQIDRPQWNEPQTDHPQWNDSQTDHSQRNEPQTDRSQTDRSQTDRPQWSGPRAERPQRSEQHEWRPAEREIPPQPRRRPAPTPVFTSSPRPPTTGRPNADSLDPESLLRGRRNAPSKGWRRLIYKASGGWIKPGESPEVRRRRELVTRARTPVTAGHHRVAVLSLKGGVGKTTTTVGLGATLAAMRGDRVIAVDANPDRGTLSDKLVLETSATVRDLLNERDQVKRYVDIRAFTSQASSRLEVLASDRDPSVSEAFSGSDYQDVSQVLENFYSICITDCGTGLLHSAMGGVLGLADQIVLVSSPSVDGARAASATLDWLEAHHYADLVKDATVVLCSVRPRSKSAVDIKKLEAHFAARCRAVIRVPYDPHLEEGAEIDLDRLQEPTREAYLQLAAYVGDGFAGIHE
ncbi:AAA family ATPase [Nonomuraea sp. NPDC050404]|uniref:nucleotide-binding protein n=1 Tax=Nonomuraea sp. NPDC050404 TaxID=3155783 RepID=UPI0033E3F001